VDFDTGLEAVEALRPLVPEGASMAQFALRWVLMFSQVSLAIPGAKNSLQAAANAAAVDLPALDEFSMRRCGEIYNQYIRPNVHQRW